MVRNHFHDVSVIWKGYACRMCGRPPGSSRGGGSGTYRPQALYVIPHPS